MKYTTAWAPTVVKYIERKGVFTRGTGDNVEQHGSKRLRDIWTRERERQRRGSQRRKEVNRDGHEGREG